MNINEYKIRLSGLACVQAPPKKGKTYDITASNVEIIDKHEVLNFNGTEDWIYKAKLSMESELNLIRENELILAKPRKGSLSQALRMQIMKLWEEQHQGRIDFDNFYNQCISSYIEDVKRQREIY